MDATFCYDADNIWQKMGWGRKDTLIRTLKKEYVENTDWKTEILKKPGIRGRSLVKYYLTKQCVHLIVIRDRTRNLQRPDSSVRIGEISMTYITRYISPGEETISFLMQVFGTRFVCVPEYPVDDYRVDLYIREANVIVECDEFGHRAYGTEAEAARTCHIQRELQDVRWVRFNPNQQDFKLSHVVQQLMDVLYHAECQA